MAAIGTTLSDINTTAILGDRRVVDMSNKIALLEPDESPLTVLLMRLRMLRAENPEYSHLEDDLLPGTSLVATSITTTGTTLAVTSGDGQYFKANDIIQNTVTGEQLRVTLVSTDNLTVVRGFESGSALAMGVGDEILRLGNASPEGATIPAIKITKTTKVTNYTEIFRTPFSATRTLQKSTLYGGDLRSYDRMKMGIEHMRDMERALWFGQKKEDTSAVVRTTGGVLERITTNVTTLGTAGLTESTFEDFLRTGFRYGSKHKVLFASPLCISKLNEIGTGVIRTKTGDKVYGLSMLEWITGHGRLNIIRNVVFEGNTYDEYAVLLDMDNIGLRFIDKTVLKPNIQAPDADGWTDEYLTEMGLQIKLEKTHSVLKNIGGSAVA